MNITGKIKAILCDENHIENSIVRNFLALPGKEHFRFHDELDLASQIGELKQKGFKSKEVLILKHFSGRLFQKCPGSPNVICCNYYILNTGFNCLFDCAYCFLNSYLNTYGIIHFINFEDALKEMQGRISGNKDHLHRIGTGEFTDSLMYDEITGTAEIIINFAHNHHNAIIEFKTKSDNVDHLIGLPHKNIVVAWTLNTERIIGLYEKGTARLENRIAAARKVQDAGFLTAFHFDPIVMYDNFLNEYFSLIDTLFHAIEADRVAWISLGCFRHSPGFKEIISETHPYEKLTLEEMFPGSDGKYRYMKRRRIDIYRALSEKIRCYSEKPFVYMCMESNNVWKSVFNVDFNSSDDLESAFNRHLKEYFYI